MKKTIKNNVSSKDKTGIVIYHDKDGVTKINACFADEDVWVTQQQLAEIYDTTQENISMHINNIFRDDELDKTRTNKKILLVRQEGNRQVKRNIDHYNLDVIIALGYKVQSQIATRFRRWATERLHEYIQKGFAMDDERLKQGGNRYFRELLQRIRDIRASERNFYQQVTDIYATSIDYDPRDQTTRDFFSTVQNKLHYAVHEHTASEIIFQRVDSEKPMVGMTNFKGDYITRGDVKVAKNYLSENELKRLNLMVSQFLDFAELQAMDMIEMRMKDWISALDNQILLVRRSLLEGKGSISHKQAMEKAEKEFLIYRQREMAQLESEFDRMTKQITKSPPTPQSGA
ncbi:MAG: virulence RhuM family protein [Mangrovibacterium sp.]